MSECGEKNHAHLGLGDLEALRSQESSQRSCSVTEARGSFGGAGQDHIFRAWGRRMRQGPGDPARTGGFSLWKAAE